MVDLRNTGKFSVVVPYKDNQFLMVYNEERGWEFPGGSLEDDESYKEAAIREFVEETGRAIFDIKYVGKIGDGKIFTGKVGDKVGEKSVEGKVRYFTSLPNFEKLSFDPGEYYELLRKAEEIFKS